MLKALTFVVQAAIAVPAAPQPLSEPGEAAAPVDHGDQQIVGVMTFDGSSEHGASLSLEISAALRRRGHWARGGKSLEEVTGELGCTNYESDCMAKAGQLFESNLVLYGTLRAEGQMHQLEMFLLDAERKEIQAHVSASIPEYDLSDGSIETKADQLLAQLWPEPEVPSGAFVLPESTPPPTVERHEPVPVDTGKRTWGPYQPRPQWKWAFFGSSVGLTVAGIVGTAVTASQLREGGALNQELFQAADDSLEDGIPGNDIDRSVPGDLCDRANAAPPGDPGMVTNRHVAEVCQKADGYQLANKVSMGIMIGGIALSSVATMLLFVRQKGPRRSSRARVRPTRSGLAVRF